MPTALVGTTRTLERTKTLTMVLAYKAAPVRGLERDRATLHVSGFITNVAGRLRMLGPRPLVTGMFVFSKAGPVRVDMRLRAFVSQTGVSKPAMATTLRLDERVLGSELTTIFSAAELRSAQRLRGRVNVLFPIAAV